MGASAAEEHSMPAHDLIVVGASAGGLEALQMLVAGLSVNLPAAVCIVLHLPPDHRSRLPEILSRAAAGCPWRR
jgi:two-component system chemotaxis response regulator CheB